MSKDKLKEKGIVVPVALVTSLGLFILNFIINGVKEKSKKEASLDNQVIIMSQQIEALHVEIKSLKNKVENDQKNISDQFQEYKVRNNNKVDLLSEKIYGLNARADTSDKLGKKNSMWIDMVNKELMNKVSSSNCSKTRR